MFAALVGEAGWVPEEGGLNVMFHFLMCIFLYCDISELYYLNDFTFVIFLNFNMFKIVSVSVSHLVSEPKGKKGNVLIFCAPFQRARHFLKPF
jgi:hypothetical protein